jgi:hypothetical protein
VVQRVLLVVAVVMLALPRLGVHAPRLEGLEAKVRASGQEFGEARKALDALPKLQPCLDSLGEDVSAEATQAACAGYEQALE